MEAMDIQAVESKLSDVTVTAIPMSGKNVHKDLGHGGNSHATISTVPASSPSSVGKDKDGTSKYAQLLAVIEEMGAPYKALPAGPCLQCHCQSYFVWACRADKIAVTSALQDHTRAMSLSWTTRWRWHTGLNADSAEWCPVDGYRHLLVCGTYQLDQDGDPKAKQTRQGKIYLFSIDESTTDLTPIQTMDSSGILDQKWCYHKISDHPILVVATSDGKIQLYRLVDLKLEFWIEASIGQDLLALSLDWSSNKSSLEPKIVVSDSSGSVSVFEVRDDLKKIGSWKSHSFEAWIAAFNYWNPDVFYSGGDDCVFKSYDVRVPGGVVTTNRSHDAGVTAVRSHTEVEHQLLTGSYDEKIRLWDARSLKRCITERNLNGGVWRLKWLPYKNDIILAACMYGGFRIVKLNEEFEVLHEYMEHESIAYGVDWKFDEKRHLVATCSFYDCKLHVSDVEL